MHEATGGRTERGDKFLLLPSCIAGTKEVGATMIKHAQACEHM